MLALAPLHFLAFSQFGGKIVFGSDHLNLWPACLASRLISAFMARPLSTEHSMGYEFNRNLNGGKPAAVLMPAATLATQAQKPARLPEMLNDQELALRLAISRKTLQKWRSLGMGPPYVKLAAKVVYRVEDINAYIQRCLRIHR